MKMEYLLCTNIYNERERIEPMFAMVSKFLLQPKKWLWIVDGSTDGSENEIERCAGLYNINVQCYILPPKDKGNLRTLGVAYNIAFDCLMLREEQYDFMMLMDVDAKFGERYPSTIKTMFRLRSDVGVISAIPLGVDELKMPTGNGKAVRWEIIKNIDTFWEPAIDTFLNIKAKAMGWKWHIMDTIIAGAPPSRNVSYAGAHHAGWFWYYASGSRWGAFKRMIFRMFKRRFGIAFMKGFLEGKRIGRQSLDADVMEFYGRR